MNTESLLLTVSSGQIEPEARPDPDEVLAPGERLGSSEPDVAAGLVGQTDPEAFKGSPAQADSDGSAASGVLDIDMELMAPLTPLSGHTGAESPDESLGHADPDARAAPGDRFGPSGAGWLRESSGQIDPEALFGANAGPEELTGSEGHADPAGLSDPDGLAGPDTPEDPDGLAIADGLGASGSRADALRVGSPRSPKASGEPKESAVGTDPLRPTCPGSSLLRSAGWPSWSVRLLCAPICTTSSSAASVNTTEPDRRADRVKKPTKIRQRFRSACQAWNPARGRRFRPGGPCMR